MKKALVALIAALAALCLLLAACSSQNGSISPVSDQAQTPSPAPAASEAPVPETSVPAAKAKPETLGGADADPDGGADAYGFAGDHQDSKYYVNPDFYNMITGGSLTILERFKTFQQTAEWSCGNATALMVLAHFGKTDLGEMDIAAAMGSHTDKDAPNAACGTADNPGEYGTNVEQMYKFFSALEGFKVVESSYSPDYADKALLTKDDGVTPNDIGNLPKTFVSASLYASQNAYDTDKWVDDAKDSYFVRWLTAHLSAGRPVMVEWGDWDGHWQAIIGYDSLGTPGIGDDILIFADPYDTSDHWQDGYYYYPLERWFYMWADRNVAPKPFQMQPYIVVDKAA